MRTRRLEGVRSCWKTSTDFPGVKGFDETNQHRREAPGRVRAQVLTTEDTEAGTKGTEDLPACTRMRGELREWRMEVLSFS